MPDAQKPQDCPNFQHPEYAELREAREICETVFGGTLEMREEGEMFLPRFGGEDDDDYKKRLAKAVLTPLAAGERDGMVGLIFCQPISVTVNGSTADNPKPLPDPIASIVENADNAGTHFDVFARRVFESALEQKDAFILVDIAPPDPTEQTALDSAEINRRPYFVHYEACQVINWREETTNGRKRLALLVIETEAEKPSGAFGTSCVKQWRVYLPGAYQVWELNDPSKSDTGFRLVEAGEMTDAKGLPLTEIPVVRLCLHPEAPPLLDLCLLNVEHYRVSSEYDDAMSNTNAPTLVIRDRANPEKAVKIGAKSLIDISGPNGDAFYLEINGKGLAATRDRLKDLETAIHHAGARVKRDGSGTRPVSATEAEIDHIRSTAGLRNWARDAEDAFEKAFQFAGVFLGLADVIEVEVNKQFGRQVDAQSLQALVTLAQSGILNPITLLAILAQSGLLPEGWSQAIEDERNRTNPPAPPPSAPPTDPVPPQTA